MRRIALLLFILPLFASADTLLRCESDGFRHECRFYGPADVSISRQLSRAGCVEGRSWGVSGNHVWVDHGCRGEFFIAQRSVARGNASILCESNGRREFCRADTSYGVHIARQLSRAGCVEGRTWGYNNNGIWVDSGCRGEFTLGNRGAGYGRRGGSEVIVCESDIGHSHTCSVDTRYGVRIARQLSRAGCIYGRTWGYNSNGIWVRDGCRAEFTVNR